MKRYLLIAITSSLFAGVYSVNNKISYERLTLPQNEKMGLVGISYLIDINPYSFFGATIYSAIDGKRGGFFTGGIEGGLKYNFGQLEANCGLFIGGGGGGSAPQGGGLMTRTYGGILYDFDRFKAGISLSKVRFPNGDIDSSQLSADIKIPYKTLYFTSLPKSQNYKSENITYSFLLEKYHPKSDKNLAGEKTQNIKNLGIEIDKVYNQNINTLFQAGGAYDGDADGYAQMLFGVRYKLASFKTLHLSLKALLGAAGGGRVDTGGGSIYKVGSDISYNFDRFSLKVGAGYMDSFDGSFNATYTNVSFGYSLLFASAQLSKTPIHYTPKKWGVTLLEQRYKSNKNMRKNSSKRDDIDLIGIKIDRVLDNNFFISATALGAYKGDAGGYAVGLVGLGYKYKIGKSYIKAHLQAGAGGGGGIASGDALITQPEIGLGYMIDKNFSLEADYSKVKAINGKLDSDVYTLGIRYELYKLER